MTENRVANEGPAFNLARVAANFSLKGTFAGGHPYGSGHIHDTFRIRTAEDGCPDYILQRINRGVFHDVPRLMENIVRVAAHLRAKSSANPGADPSCEVLTVIPTRDGRHFHEDNDGDCWRVYVFIDRHRSFDRVDSAELACAGGEHFGRFLRLLADFPDPPLHETIGDFHNLEMHLQRFFARLQDNPCRRARQVAAETDCIQARADAMKRILRLGQAKRIPLRITHNDTKFNNILFAEQGGGACIIDLDTVMPGYVHYDFGDAVRSGCNRANEDEPDLELVGLDIDLFKGYARGFLKSLRDCLTAEEIAHLTFSARLFAFMVGLRFLSDFLAGDRYFKSRYPGHNLQRARVQFRLLESMERQSGQMDDIIRTLAAAD
ncbi:MAG: aminoglycoside phosphotransferase family protein [Candidatus Aminicenantes bacterium]|nr:aminoglycoside phosphotransferase family protein [Candidatus Aminicenantes bacterium]